MNGAVVLLLWGTAWQAVAGSDITFTNRIASFTNLQGQVYRRVLLIRGDDDGLIWRDGVSGGRVCYTNLHPDVLEYFGISSNRIEIARLRAEKKAVADARFHALVAAEGRRPQQTQSASTNAVPSAVALPPDVPANAYNPPLAYNPNPLYPPFFPFVPFDTLLPPAPSAPSAASAPSASSAPRAMSAPPVGMAISSGSSPAVSPTTSAGHAHSAPGAPPATGSRR